MIGSWEDGRDKGREKERGTEEVKGEEWRKQRARGRKGGRVELEGGRKNEIGGREGRGKTSKQKWRVRGRKGKDK